MDTVIIAALLVAALAALALGGLVFLLFRRPAQGDANLDSIAQALNLRLDEMSKIVRELEKDREFKFGELGSQLKLFNEQTATLNKTTGDLREALASPRVRGQWGERMAEDVLRLVGFREGVNYEKQRSADGNNARPDFTFRLPRDQRLNMDVKFPLDNYTRYVEAQHPQEKEQFRRAFLRDVRSRLKEVVTREYIDPRQNTLGCVLVFIPNEQIYQFVQEQDGSLMDEALRNQVVLCSPTTLFAILVVVRQAVDNFAVERASNEIISLMGAFNRQWEDFAKQMDTLGRRLESAQGAYDLLVERRRRALERPLGRIEEIRKQHGIALPAEPDGTAQQTALDMSDGQRPGPGPGRSG